MILSLPRCLTGAGGGLRLAIGLGLVLAATPAAADWRDDLEIEIRAEHGCDLAYMSHVVEREVDGRKVILVKVHCMDQRSFDATRHDDKEFFRFSECTRVQSETC